MQIETKRLILRPWNDNDAKWLYECAKDKEIGPIAGWPIHNNIEHSQLRIKQFLKEKYNFAIYHKQLQHIIGLIAVYVGKDSTLALEDDECEIGYWLGKDYWGHNYMHETLSAIMEYFFKNMQIDRVYASFAASNDRSANVLKRFGFELNSVKYNVYNTFLDTNVNLNITSLDKDKFYAFKKS